MGTHYTTGFPGPSGLHSLSHLPGTGEAASCVSIFLVVLMKGYKVVTRITCGHMFCFECIVNWLNKQPEMDGIIDLTSTCPICRDSVERTTVFIHGIAEVMSLI